MGSEDGTGTVVITVTSESGNAIEYVLHVTTARGEVDPAEAIAANEGLTTATIDTEIVQSEVETEDPRYVKVDRNSLQDAENTIEKLQKTITEQRSHISMLTYVLYALIAVSIIFCMQSEHTHIFPGRWIILPALVSGRLHRTQYSVVCPFPRLFPLFPLLSLL